MQHWVTSAALIMTLGACHQAETSASSVVISTNGSGEPFFNIDPADTTCRSSEECGFTNTSCLSDCGDPVNLAHAKKYVAARERMCKSYGGKPITCTDTAVCESGVCRVKK
jgi:hypothetical protein